MRKKIELKVQAWSDSPSQKKESKREIKAIEQSWNQVERVGGTSVPRKAIELRPVTWDAVEHSEGHSHKGENAIQIQPVEWAVAEQPVPTNVNKNDEKIQMTKQEWEPIPGITEPNIIRQFDGVNQLNPFAIKDTQATRNKNFTTSKYPALATRTGYSYIADMGTNDIWGLAAHKGTELHIICGTEWKKLTNETTKTFASLKTGLTQNPWYFCNFQGNFPQMNLLATNGSTAYRYDGTSVVPLANAPALANFICTHDNRVYVAAGSTVYFSALRKAEDWSTVDDSGSIIVETSDGKPITGMVAGAQRLTIFKENSIHELFGTRPANFQMKPVTDNLGCAAGRSIQVVEGMMYFLGNDGIYRYNGGSAPKSEFAIPVQNYVRQINRAYADKSVSWTKEGKYYVAFPTGSNQKNNLVLEYDIQFNTWNVWEMNDEFSVGCVQANNALYGGDKNGLFIKFDGSDKDAGGDIAYEWVTKPYALTSLAAKSRWFRLWVVAEVPPMSYMNIYLNESDVSESWQLIKSIGSVYTSGIQKIEIHVPTTVAAFSNYIRLRIEGTGPVKIYEIARQERVFPMGFTS